MNNFYGMTKEELIAKCRKLQSENKFFRDELDHLNDCYYQLENSYADAINVEDQPDIVNLEYFKYRLEIDGLLTPQLESFIEDYLKYYNVVKG